MTFTACGAQRDLGPAVDGPQHLQPEGCVGRDRLEQAPRQQGRIHALCTDGGRVGDEYHMNVDGHRGADCDRPPRHALPAALSLIGVIRVIEDHRAASGSYNA
jgi:hypothetical protein